MWIKENIPMSTPSYGKRVPIFVVSGQNAIVP